MAKNKPAQPAPVTVPLNSAQIDRFKALLAGTEKSELIFNANKAQLDLYIASIRDMESIEDELTGIRLEDTSIIFSVPQEGPQGV